MMVCVLGHNGMLGHMVKLYFDHHQIAVNTTDYRWPTLEFKEFIEQNTANYCINCIAAIPQKRHSSEEFHSINYLLPQFLADNFKGKLIHPSTDASTEIDFYTQSKKNAHISLLNQPNSKIRIIRSSIIGPEIKSKNSIFEWLLANKEVDGYQNHFWNGITTLEWAKMAKKLTFSWDDYDLVTNLGTECISKFDLLCTIVNSLKINVEINRADANVAVNRCINSDIALPGISKQLQELNAFYKGNFGKDQ